MPKRHRTQEPNVPLYSLVQELFEYNISSNMWIQQRPQVTFVSLHMSASSFSRWLRLPLRGTAPRVQSQIAREFRHIFCFF